LDEETDLIVLPEMFNTGFAMSPLRIAEAKLNGPTGCQWIWENRPKRKGGFGPKGNPPVGGGGDLFFLGLSFFLTGGRGVFPLGPIIRREGRFIYG